MTKPKPKPKQKTVHYATITTKITRLEVQCNAELKAEIELNKSFVACNRDTITKLNAIELKLDKEANAVIKSEFNSIKAYANNEFIKPVNKTLTNLVKYHKMHDTLLAEAVHVQNSKPLIDNLTNIKNNINMLEKKFQAFKASTAKLEEKLDQLEIKITVHEAKKRLNKLEAQIDKLAESITEIIENRDSYELQTLSVLVAKLKNIAKLSNNLEAKTKITLVAS